MSIGWNFPPNNFGQLNGISEAGIETFRGAQYSSLAREVCQNSLDAVLDKDEPVIVEFQKKHINKDDIPGYVQLEDALERCLEFWSRYNNKKATDFFKNSCDVINQENIATLRISDFNTKGLTGSDKEYEITPWQSLVKSSGVSDKSGAAGGSYGIGKSAPYACSDIRTLFYSTYDVNNLVATQGVSRLVTFEDNSGQLTQGVGYFGNTERNTALNTELKIDKTFERKENTGTDIYILGFMEDVNWKEEMIASVLDGFLVSINNEDLIVKIDDVTISKETLPLIINQYKSNAKYAYNYYQVLTSEDSFIKHEDFADLGQIELRVLLGQNLHRKALITRSTGMKIFDKANISGTIQFAAILTLKDEGVNKFFRDMESPQHDAWEPDRHPDKKNAKKRRAELFKYIKETIHEIGRNTEMDKMDAEGVGEFLPDNISDTEILNQSDIEETITDKTKDIDIKVVDKVLVSKGISKVYDIIADEEVAATGDLVEDEEGDGVGRKPTGEPNSSNGGIGTAVSATSNNSSENPIKKYVEVGIVSTRLFISDKTLNKYKLVILPEKSASTGYVKISLSGEQSSVEANIKAAYTNSDSVQLKCSKGNIYIDKIIEKEKISLSFILDYSDNCSMEVSLYGHSV